METPVAPSAAPAPPVAPTDTIPATRAAVDTGNVQAFLEAKHAERVGKPLEPVPVAEPAKAEAAPVEPETPTAPERAVSKRQQDINDKIREAVERATAPLQAELARLRTPNAPAAPAPSTPATPPEPEWKRIAKLPDAPKLADFESVEEHAAAMALFVSHTREQEQQQASATAQRTRALEDQTQTFAQRLTAAREADPDLLTKIPPALIHAKPLSGLAQGEPFTFGNVVMEAAFHAEQPAALLTHLHTHPEIAERISALPVDRQLWELGQLAGRLSAPAPSMPPAPPPAPAASPATVSQFPQPQPTLARGASVADPERAALDREDVPGFLDARRAKRLARAREAQGRTA